VLPVLVEGKQRTRPRESQLFALPLHSALGRPSNERDASSQLESGHCHPTTDSEDFAFLKFEKTFFGRLAPAITFHRKVETLRPFLFVPG